MELKLHRGAEAGPFIERLAEFRITYFREYPYLYQGTPAYEAQYLKGYYENPRALLVTVHQQGALTGISTGIPLGESDGITQGAAALLARAGLRPEAAYYFGEIILAPEARGSGLCRRIFRLQEQAAAALGYKATCLLSVLRPADHPLKPPGYRETDTLWRHLGYSPLEGTVSFSWPVIQPQGPPVEQENPMALWAKAL